MDLEIRELERETVGIFPERVLMESETVLVQYIISDWSLFYRFVVLKSDCSRGFLLMSMMFSHQRHLFLYAAIGTRSGYLGSSLRES